MLTDFWYVALLVSGLILASVLFAVRLKKQNLRPVFVLPMMAVILLTAVISGKILYLLFSSNLIVSDNWLAEVFHLNPAEFSFTGLLAGASLGTILAARLIKLPVPEVLDCFALPFCLLAAFVRFAEIFVGDLGLAEMATFGLEEISDGSVLAFFPFAIRDQWGQWLLALSTLETICIIITAFMILLSSFRSHRDLSIPCDGALFELALFILCAIGFFFETAKISGVVFYYVHVEQVFSALIMLILLIRLCSRLSHIQKHSYRLPVTLFFAFLTINAFSQYFMDKAWRFTSLFSESVFDWLSDHLCLVCYSVMMLTTICMIVLYLLSFRKLRSYTGAETKLSSGKES